MNKALKYFIYAKLPLFLITLMNFLIVWFLKVYWVIEKAVTNSTSSMELNASNILLAFVIGMLINLVLSIVLGAFGNRHIADVSELDIRQILFMGLLFWVLAAGFENSLRAAFYMIVVLSLGEISFRTKWGSRVGL